MALTAQQFTLLILAGLALVPTALVAEPNTPREKRAMATEPESDYFARAFHAETGELIYTEHHTEMWRERELVGQQVRYVAPDGELLAQKEIDYAPGLATPSFELVDRRDGYREGARRVVDAPNTIELFSGRGELDRNTVTAPTESVLDAGFHRFVQRNLGALQDGDVLDFAFGVPSLGRFVDFQVERTRASEDRPGQMRLEMKPANRLLRLLVSPIRLVYGLDGRLLEFEGISNINDDRGKSYVARIVFEYPS